jgi:hypothetical protein
MELRDCPVPHCETTSDQPFMCRNHWRHVPKELKERVRAGEPGALDAAITTAIEFGRGYHGRHFDPVKALA